MYQSRIVLAEKNTYVIFMPYIFRNKTDLIHSQ